MEKFLSLEFGLLVILVCVLLVIHEWGHYLAYRMLGYEAQVRKSVLVPGIDPKETIEVARWEGLIIALSGFVFSTVIVILPLAVCHYKLGYVLLIGSIAGSCVDFIWAFTMLFQKRVTISSR